MEIKKKVCANIANIKLASLTCDCWTSNSVTSHLSVTLHYIDEHMFMHNIDLALKYLDHDHDSVYLGSQISQILDEWQLTNKVFILLFSNRFVLYFTFYSRYLE